MGAFDQAANITIPDDEGDPVAAAEFRRRWGWEPHEIIILRGSYTAADMEAIGNASMALDKQKNPVFSAGSGRLHLLHRMIVGWTLKAGGRDVPVSLEAIRRLPASYSTPVLEKCDELAKGLTEEEQEDFFISANGHSEESSGEMRLSLLPSSKTKSGRSSAATGDI